MALWKGSKNGEPNTNEDGEQEAQPRPTSSSRNETGRRSEDTATERTRLLADRPPPRGGYLDPDDPAVRLHR